MGTRAWTPCGGIVVLATTLVLLLVLHHPLMEMMPGGAMGNSASTATLSVQGSRSAPMVATPGMSGAPLCLGVCALPCPLMQGVTPDRLTLTAPLHAMSPYSGACAALPAMGIRSSSAWVVTRHVAARARPQGTRRAVLQVFLL